MNREFWTVARIIGLGILALIIMLLWRALSAHAQLTSNGDWCLDKNVPKESAVISITTSGAGEHQIVALEAGEPIQVCGFRIELTGTTPSAEFDYGTQVSTACDTGPTALTGAMLTTPNAMSGPQDYFTAPAGKQLCLNLGGTTPTAIGWITFAQKSP